MREAGRLSPGSALRRVTDRHSVAASARRVLEQIAGGRLRGLPFSIRFWDGSVLPAGPEDRSLPGGPVVVMRNDRAISHLLHEPHQLGLGRAWVQGALDVEGDLADVLATRPALADVRLSVEDRIRLVLAALRVAGLRVLRRPPVPAIEASVQGRRHSLARDRVAVRHHYDLSNDFYRLVLGPTMVYSCAYFAGSGAGPGSGPGSGAGSGSGADELLDRAQERKLDLLCRKLALQPGERLLDIGCGWGSLVHHAAAHYGVRGVGITLSEPQAEWARARALREGLENRVEFRVADYREVADGPYDKVVSVGMYEHVGRSELSTYVRDACKLVRSGGLFLNHGIARLWSDPPTSDTFISRYVFPDGELHPLSDLTTTMGASGFEVRDVESLREHYPLTLRAWTRNLRERRDEAIALVGVERVRAWELYMLASAQSFEAGEITVYQVLAARRDGPPGLPLDRAEWLLGVSPAAR
jgi:cyclopropane-fatty-acyl-phospholipid synthase